MLCKHTQGPVCACPPRKHAQKAANAADVDVACMGWCAGTKTTDSARTTFCGVFTPSQTTTPTSYSTGDPLAAEALWNCLVTKHAF